MFLLFVFSFDYFGYSYYLFLKFYFAFCFFASFVFAIGFRNCLFSVCAVAVFSVCLLFTICLGVGLLFVLFSFYSGPHGFSALCS